VHGESVLVREVSSVAAGELVAFGESVGARVLPSDAGEEPPLGAIGINCSTDGELYWYTACSPPPFNY